MNNENNNQFYLLSVLSVILGYQNLIENRQQTAQNDVNAANNKQTEILFNRLENKFNEQNQKIEEILEILKKEKRG